MKKNTVAVLLVIFFFVGMTFGGVSFGSGQGISVLINGKYLNSSPGPVMINDRVFVPLRAVSENMGASVGWDYETQTAYIATPGNPEDIEIVGPPEFKQAMTDALKLLKNKSTEDYKFVGQYCRKIVLDDNMRAPGTQGYNMEIHVPTDYSNADQYWWAATLVHEATHVKYDYNVIRSTAESEEIEGANKSIEVLRKIGAPQWMIDYVKKGVIDKWWEQSPLK